MKWADWVVIGLAVLTILGGGMQAVAPQAALGFMGVAGSSDTIVAFRLASLFELLFGGALLHATLIQDGQALIALWAGLQKVVAAATLGVAVSRGLLPRRALGVAGYDCLAAAFLVWRGRRHA